MDHYFETIDGWFDWPDLYAQWVREAPPRGTIVEVGAIKGKSFAFLGVEAVNAGRRDLALVAVDTFEGSVEHQDDPVVARGALFETFHDGALCPLIDAGLNAKVLILDSRLAARQFADGTVDRVFLDGDHSREGVAADLAAWWPKVKPGGELAGHDLDWPSVAETVDAWATRTGLVLERVAPRSFRLRKAAPVTSWAVPEGSRKCLVVPVSNMPVVSSGASEALMRIGWGPRVLVAMQAHGFSAIEPYFERGSPRVDAMRDHAVFVALRSGFSHLLFLDTDMRFPQDTLVRLLAHHDRGIVSALYFQRHDEFKPIALRRAEDPTPGELSPEFTHAEDVVDATDLVPVDVVGMGCTLIPVEVFRQFGRPWFGYQDDRYGYPTSTEDVSFCLKAASAGCPVSVDPTIRCGHEYTTLIGVESYRAKREASAR